MTPYCPRLRHPGPLFFQTKTFKKISYCSSSKNFKTDSQIISAFQSLMTFNIYKSTYSVFEQIKILNDCMLIWTFISFGFSIDLHSSILIFKKQFTEIRKNKPVYSVLHFRIFFNVLRFEIFAFDWQITTEKQTLHKCT